MKITFVTGHLCKERHALLNELALDLGENGAEVTVVTGFPSRRISQEVREYYLNHPVEHLSESVTVRRVGTRKGEGTGLLVRMLKYVALSWVIYREIKDITTDVYYFYSSPPFLGLVGAKLAKAGHKTVYNAQDLFPDTLVHMKHLSESNPLVKNLRRMEQKIYRENTRVITISEEMKRIICSAGCMPQKVDVINNWADTVSLHHISRLDNKLMDELKIDKSKFIISYAGDIGLFQGWDVILEAVEQMQTQNLDVLFVIIGSGSYKEKMLEVIRDRNLENIMVLPLQSASRLSEIYSIGDIELVPIEKGITKMALPSKIGVIMATGSTILAMVDSGSDITAAIKKYQLGYAIEHGSATLLAETIQECFKDRERLPEFGRNAKHYATVNYARKVQTRRYFDILQQTSKKTNHLRSI